MTPFEVDSAPLQGANLIEAGAGTGKTHAIAGIFVRLIVEQALSIDQILVVTYTKAATEELKSRIRQRLRQARQALEGRSGVAPSLAVDWREGLDPAVARRRIQDALIDFDRAAIYTIHGFCQRLLRNYAFETGHLFDAELVQEIGPLIQETADDFWRRHITCAPLELAAYAADTVQGPERFARLLIQRPIGALRIVPEPVKPSLRAIRPWREIAAQVRSRWPQAQSDVEALLLSPALNAKMYGNIEGAAPTPRQITVAGLFAALAQWDGIYPLFKGFERLTTRQIARATKKKFTAPGHPFFDLCQAAWERHAALESQLEGYLRYLKVKFLQRARQTLQVKKARLNLLFFDDLLTRTHQALHSDCGAALTQAVQTQYRAALVDEFQDTDPLQYEIFGRLFAGEQQLLFMIGDPKQAIYSFRGADLFSYLLARRNALQCYTLTRNYRATPDLVQAVNTIFSAHPKPFGIDAFAFEPAVSNQTPTGVPAEALRLWYLTGGAGEEADKPLSRSEAVRRIVAAVASEIVALLEDPEQGWQPEQIAVLTRTHHQARLVKSALAQCRVPAVLHSAGRVFDTPEAEELLLVMRAAAEPSDVRRLRAALATRLLGATARELCDSVENPSEGWRAHWRAFDAYHQIWLSQGFFRMFSRMLIDEKIKPRLLGAPDGERRLTDLLHLAELIHQAATARALGVEGVLKWLETQCDQDSGDNDAQKLRLESDACAVRIITIHKSKGLQFDVVFCPFTWAGARTSDDMVFLHDPQNSDQPTLAVGPGIAPEWRAQALTEALAENLRLFYVALTRAKLRCYLVWGRINQTALSAPAYLLHGCDLPSADWPQALEERMKTLSDLEMIADLRSVAARSGNTIGLHPLPRTGPRAWTPRSQSPAQLNHRVYSGRIDFSWRVASYSSMIAHVEAEAAEWPDHDQRSRPSIDRPIDFAELNDFPAGAQAGLFFHDLLEQVDLSARADAGRERLVRDCLAAHGYDLQWADATGALLDRLAAAPLSAAGEIVRLGEVPPGACVKEMAFYFPLKQVGAQDLRELFALHGKRMGMPDLDFQLERLSFAPMHGYMKGFIDMVFQHNGRYYLLDWKSNYLGERPQDYGVDRLTREMAAAWYFLQYTLYATALDQWLRSRLTDYRYGTHFGGLFYLFLRGIRGVDADSGVYFALPEESLILALRNLLLDV